MLSLPGTREPRLRPLSPDLCAWTEAVMESVRPDRLRATVESLPAPRNRLHAPEAMARADTLILQALADAGWQTERRPFTLTNAAGCLDYVPENGVAAGGRGRDTIYPRLDGVNLLGIKPGENSTDAIVIGAHHDTVRDSPGADDNTASVAALLELARALSPFRFRDTILLAVFDMEELCLLGSPALIEDLRRERRITGALVYETMCYTDTTPNSQRVPPGIDLLFPGQIARLRRRGLPGDWTVVIYRRDSAKLARTLGEGLAHLAGAHVPVLMRDPTDLALVGGLLRRRVPAARHFSRSDHASFWRAGIPAIMIGDTADLRNPHYHQPTDTPDTLDYERLAAIVGATATVIARHAGLRFEKNSGG